MNRLEGRVALVTGAASGIGKTTAQRLVAEGSAVLVTDIQVEVGEATVKEINDAGGRAAFFKYDVTSEADWEAACARAIEEFGALDILVNNAGMGDIKPIEETTLADWDRTVAIDQTGVFLGMKIAAPHLKKSEHASVINISSIFGSSGGFGVSPAYHAAKGAVRTLTKNVALHWATEGVRVNSVHPGFIATPILEQSRNTPIWDGMTALTPMGRLGRPRTSPPGLPISPVMTRPSSPVWSCTSTAASWPADSSSAVSDDGHPPRNGVDRRRRTSRSGWCFQRMSGRSGLTIHSRQSGQVEGHRRTLASSGRRASTSTSRRIGVAIT
jgi:NAD(P)-dependent dehydrogenase (short-subunit alcohol dehydrogenase family)